MSNFSKKFAVLFVIATLALIAAQCGGPTPTPITIVETVEVEVEKEVKVVETVEVVVEKEVTVIETVEVEVATEGEKVVEVVRPIIYNSYNSDPEPRAFDEKMVALFNERNPDTPLDHSVVQHEDFKQAIRAYLVADPAPDVMTWFAGNRGRFFIDRGLIMDISDVWEEEGWNEDYPKGFRAMSEVDGKAYFLPSNWYWWAVFYRKSIFEEHGITPPETWDEMLTACDTLDGAGIIPITIGTKYRWTAAAWFDYINMRLNGPEFHLNLMLGNETYDDPRLKAVFMKWQELFDHKCFIDDAAAYSWQEAIDPLAQGDAAMYLMGQFIMDSVPDDVAEDMDFFRFPIIDPDMPIGEDAPTDGYFMSVNANNADGGKSFLRFMGGVESQTMMVEELGRLPVHTGVDEALFTPMQQKGLELIRGTDLVVQFFDRDTTPEMADVGMNGMMDFWADPYDEEMLDEIILDLEATRAEIFDSE
ncbi:ABC transporter substrate-binding protein [Anaerolineales bacterium HSG24]|nr:ABC transporter substrate-binding protein [Anaerolineales bacterium HSG24]